MHTIGRNTNNTPWNTSHGSTNTVAQGAILLYCIKVVNLPPGFRSNFREFSGIEKAPGK